MSAKRILLQRYVVDALGNGDWTTVEKAKVKHRKKHDFAAIAGEGDTERFRARVLYPDSRPLMSKPITATVWHWTDFFDFTAYYVTPGVDSSKYLSFTMNGRVYRGMYTRSSGPSWELRFTPGRHCKAFRGELGVTDKSADGSSAAIQLLADDVTVLASGPLTPGMTQPFNLDLATPYRLAIQAQNTSPADQSAYPAIGIPELLCTGLT
jgi:hypothetical protein